MARNDRNAGDASNTENPVTDPNANAGAATTTAAAVAENKADERFVKITVSKTDGTTETLNRVDICRQLWRGENPAGLNDATPGKKWSRGEIAKKLSDVTGKKVVYQIVNAAVKGIPGGPDKVAETPPSGSAPQQGETPAA